MAYELNQMWMHPDQYGLKATYPMTPQGMVVHNTATKASARAEATLMLNRQSSTSYHVIVDETEVIEMVPFSRNTWHGGDGGSGYANRNLIGLEIARSMDETTDYYDRAENNAAEYIAHVCLQFGWSSDNLHQHNWYSATACPHRTKEHWQEFLARVDARIAELQAPTQEPKRETVRVSLHGYMRDVQGRNLDGRVYVAVSDLLPQMGYEVGWQDGVVTIGYKR